MLPEAIVSSLMVALIRRGKLSNLQNVNIKGWYFLIISSLIQSLGSYLYNSSNIDIVKFIENYYQYIHILSYIILFFGLLLNVDKKSFRFIISGAFMNFIAIISNQGKMPVHVPFGPNPKLDLWHTVLTENSRFIFFTDVIPLPKPYPFPKILSVGDLLIIVGTFLFIQNCIVKKDKNILVKTLN